MKNPTKDLGIPLLKFLWKWKVATTTALALKFYPKASALSTYNRLIELAIGGYIQCVSSRTGSGGVWMLTDKGFSTIREDIPLLSVQGYKSEFLSHDLLSMAAMTGEWIRHAPAGVLMYSEQQLRRIEPTNYPMWVPQTDAHRADGYWRLPKLPENSSIALEIERTHKSFKRYELAADFYRDFKFVKGIVWITPFHGSRSRVAEKLSEYLGDEASCHWFVSLEDFTKDGWQAKFRIGKPAGRTISETFSALTVPSQGSGTAIDSRLLLQTRKKPRDFSPESLLQTHGFFD